MKSLLRAVLIVGILFALPVCAQEPAGRRTGELMQKSGLHRQLGQVRDQMKEGAAQGREQAKASAGAPPLSDEDFARILGAMEKAYAPATLQASMSKELARILPAADERAVLEWLSSDLGRKFTEIEEKSGEAEAMTRGVREAPAYFDTVPKPRVELFRQLVDEVHAGQALASIVINISIGVAVGVSLADPNNIGPEAMAKRVREKLEPERSKMVAYFNRQALMMYAYIYRDMSDADVGRYVAFANTPSGRRYHDATITGMDVVFTRAALDLGRQFQMSRAEPRTRS